MSAPARPVPPSPAAIKPRSEAARRMSTTSTFQSTALTHKGFLQTALDTQQLVVAGLVSSLMLWGIMYSLIYNTSLNTSEIHNNHFAERVAYFARKSNLLNVIFVKRAWAWTSGIYLLHLFTSPSSSFPRSSKGRRFAVLILATLCWAIFARWFFGAGLGDRVIALTGGNCAVPLPPSVSPNLAKHHFPTLFTSGLLPDGSERLYVPLPHQFCSGEPLTPVALPNLFALFPDVASAAGAGAGVGKGAPTAQHESLTPVPRPRWHRGFDISGHAFLLTLSTMILARELAPTWRAALLPRRTPPPTRSSSVPATPAGQGTKSQLHVAAGLLGTELVGVWLWMILMTAVYFHNPPEKLAGLALGLSCYYLISILIPAPSLAPSAWATPFRAQTVMTPSRTTSVRMTSVVGGVDENSARRERVDGGDVDEEGSGEEMGSRMGTRGGRKRGK